MNQFIDQLLTDTANLTADQTKAIIREIRNEQEWPKRDLMLLLSKLEVISGIVTTEIKTR